MTLAQSWKEEGIQIGIERGIERGIEKGILKVAKSLIGLLPDELISEKTGLSIEVIQSLKN